MKGKRWLLLSRGVNLTTQKKRQLNALFALNRRVMKAYLLKESLDRLWSYRYAGAPTGRESLYRSITQGFTLGYFPLLPTGGTA